MTRRRVRILLALSAALFAVPALPLSGQSKAVSTTMTVSVNVVRGCSVATPTAFRSPAPSNALPESAVQIRCGRAASSASQAPGVLPLVSAPAPAAIESSRTPDGLQVAVNF